MGLGRPRETHELELRDLRRVSDKTLGFEG